MAIVTNSRDDEKRLSNVFFAILDFEVACIENVWLCILLLSRVILGTGPLYHFTENEVHYLQFGAKVNFPR